MHAWSETTLGQFVTLQRGHDLPDPLRRPGKVPVMGSFGVTGFHDTARAKGPGVTVGRSGASIGVVSFTRDDYWPLNTALYVIDFHGNDERFAYYFLKSLDLARLNSGSAQPSLNRNFVHPMKVRVPGVEEQRQIAGMLGALDDKIALNRRMNETLEAMARAIFKSWFVDFDPVRAKSEGRNPAGMDEATAALFPNAFQPSPLGPIPKGWNVTTLADLCSVGRGASPRPIHDYMNGEVPWLKIADATAAGGPFVFETQEKLKKEGVERSVPVSPGDLVLSNSATCGVPVFVELHGCIHDGWLHFKNLRLISKIYLYHALLRLGDHLVQIADGSVQKNLNTQLVGDQLVIVPSPGIVAAFDELANSLFRLVRENGLESRTLAATRDTLLPKLLSGELSIGGAA